MTKQPDVTIMTLEDVYALSQDQGIARAAKLLKLPPKVLMAYRKEYLSGGKPSDTTLTSLEGERASGSVAILKGDCAVARFTETNTIKSAAEHFGITQRAVRSMRKKSHIRVDWTAEFAKIREKVDKSARQWDTHPCLTGDWGILADAHLPFIHWPTFIRALTTFEYLGIRNIVLPGDWFDFEDISKFDFGGEQFDIAAELDIGRDVLFKLAERFDRVVFFRGNHEERLFKFLKRIARLYEKHPDLMRFQAIVGRGETETVWQQYKSFMETDGVEISNDSLAFINDDIMVCHASSTTRIPPNSEQVLGEKYRRHVIGCHMHNYGQRVGLDGKTLATRIGTVCDPDKIFYKTKRTTTHYEWVKGFAWVKDGKIGTWIDCPAWYDAMGLEIPGEE